MSQLRLSAVVEHNSVTVHNSATFFNGIVLLGAVSQITIQGNKVMGDVGVAMGAGAIFPGDQIDQPISNRFLLTTSPAFWPRYRPSFSTPRL